MKREEGDFSFDAILRNAESGIHMSDEFRESLYEKSALKMLEQFDGTGSIEFLN